MIRSTHRSVGASGSLVAEMGQGELGDRRLNERRDRLVATLERHPDTAFPDACANDAEVEALYRFLRNQRVSPTAIVEPHIAATRERCAALGEVLVIHDTTDMVFAGETTRRGLARLGKGRHGFWLHAGLAVSTDGLRAPLGLLSLMPFVRKMQVPGTKKDERARFADPAKESRCWFEGVAAARERLTNAVPAIDVMDRGGDSYELFAALIAHRERFVIRLHHDRRVVTSQGARRLQDPPRRRKVLCERQIYLGSRHTGRRPQQSLKKHPPREARMVTLRMRARRVTLQRPDSHQATTVKALNVNVIDVWEAVPPPNDVAVEWRLVTTEPVDTVDQVLRIVDWYRARWVIEEFFKALKTGCAYEKRQLESLDTLLVALALLAPIAWQMLLWRHLARAAPTASVGAVLSPRQLQVLRASAVGTLLRTRPTLQATLSAVARLGGHLRQNGPPGWLVLGRGMQKLLLMESGWAAAEQARMM